LHNIHYIHGRIIAYQTITFPFIHPENKKEIIMNEQENINLVKQSYERFLQGDIAGVIQWCADDIKWETPGPSDIPTAGKYEGIEHVGEFFSKLANTFEPVSFEPQEFIAQHDKVVTLGEYKWRVKSTGRTFYSKWAHVSTIRNGKLWRFVEYGDTAAAMEAVRGK
jgi:ketosteroid isomerase-like protein